MLCLLKLSTIFTQSSVEKELSHKSKITKQSWKHFSAMKLTSVNGDLSVVNDFFCKVEAFHTIPNHTIPNHGWVWLGMVWLGMECIKRNFFAKLNEIVYSWQVMYLDCGLWKVMWKLFLIPCMCCLLEYYDI